MSDESQGRLFVIECPKCRAPFRFRGVVGTQGESLCPQCGEALTVIMERNVDGNDYATVKRNSHLPIQPSLLTAGDRVRGSQKEEWMPAPPPLKPLQFEKDVGRAQDKKRYDANDPDRLKRRALAKARHRRHQTSENAWETAEARTEVSGRKRRRMERRQRRIAWIAGLCGVGLLAIVVIALIAYEPWREKIVSEVESLAPEPVGIPTLKDVEATGRQFSVPTHADYNAAADTLRRFVQAPTPDAAAELCLDPVTVKQRQKAWHASYPWQPLNKVEIPRWLDLVVFKNLVVANLNADDGSSRIGALVKTADGFKADWESYVGWGEVPWDQLAVVCPKEPIVIRARIEPTQYYNFQFSDEATWASYRLTPMDRLYTITGYVDRTTPLFQEINSALKGSKLVLATLRIKFPPKVEDSKHDPTQAYITEWIANGWVVEKGAK